jgi:outer membrane protein assembly factor BamB
MLQRASLVLDGSRVVFGFGGNYGDCGPYHGWVESVPVTGGRPYRFDVDSGRGEREGAVWMGGAAPIVTKAGDIYVAVGNGSAAPSVLPNGLVLQAGKSQTIYLLRQSHLGGIGGQLQERTGACGNDFGGGAAFSGSTAYLPCDNGLMAVRTDAAEQSLAVAWQTSSGAAGAPILVGGLLFVESGGDLYALRRTNGSVEATYPVGSTASHFPTPSYGDRHVFAVSTDQVHAFVER